MKNKIFISTILLMAVLANGCKTGVEKIEPTDYARPLPFGQFALRKITSPENIPDFTIACYELDNLRETIDNSLNYLSKPSSKRFFPSGDITHRDAVESLEAFAMLLDLGLMGKELNAAIRQKFDVYTSVGYDNLGTVLFTGYFTPIFDGSMVETERFKYPLYTQPEDLIKGQDGDILGRRTPNGEFIPYPSRAEIERTGILKGKELVWLSDAFEVYIAHVQGSTKIRLTDGELITVGYAANNGHEYKSIAAEVIKANSTSTEQSGLSAMINYSKTHPEQMARYIQKNPRYVFFRIEQGPPRGSLNEPVIAMRTIATDKSIYPRGCLAFISSALPTSSQGGFPKRHYTGFALDQDTGGAIRAAGRCDIYIGQGEVAGKKAGQIYQKGRLYYLFLKR